MGDAGMAFLNNLVINILWILLFWIIISLIIIYILNLSFNYDVELKFVWFDLWIGIYYDRDNKIIHINSLPCIVWICKKDV